MNLGIALSFEARNELQVIQFIPLVLLPQVFLCGSVLADPDAVATAAVALDAPPDDVRGARAPRGDARGRRVLIDIATELAALAVFALAMIALGIAVLRRLRV